MMAAVLAPLLRRALGSWPRLLTPLVAGSKTTGVLRVFAGRACAHARILPYYATLPSYESTLRTDIGGLC